jgi:hypothetical protein
VGSLSGFPADAVTVTASTQGAFAIQPTVSWFLSGTTATQPFWIVSWISGAGSAYSLAQRYDASGHRVGDIVDPGVPSLAAAALPDQSLLSYEAARMSGSFAKVTLGCL